MPLPATQSVLDLGSCSPVESQETLVQSQNVDKRLPEYKVVVVGASAVGKSALIIQMIYKQFVKDHDPTIQDTYWKDVVQDEGGYVLQVMDTSGQDIHRSLCNHCLASGDGVLVVFALDDLSTLHQLPQMRATWGTHVNQPLVLVGNKCDLVPTISEDARAAVAALAKSWGAPFVETSAKTQKGVEEAFSLLVREIQRTQEAKAGAAKKNVRPQKAMCTCGCSVA
ncbi:GTPase ERas-like [Perognathus longimembris pacificus]|uniref:GTPase ERas-like n=1 Tax=Perognathus longimembris pacificus TaxID=214514 RepID=UPI0020199705|nr:GTPase ERas-like [Perognathus longimembris pacificus]